MPDVMLVKMPVDMPDRMPEDMPENMPEDMPDRMPDRMPEALPDTMPDSMPDKMADRMPEDLPVTKCMHVMVGITRSKVFFNMLASMFLAFSKLCLCSMSCLFLCTVYAFNYVHIYIYKYTFKRYTGLSLAWGPKKFPRWCLLYAACCSTSPRCHGTSLQNI
jgi:hypothetical protein